MSKKICDVCGMEIGFLSQRKLKDGIACFDCMQKLGKDFSIYSETFSKEQVIKGISGEIKLIPPIKCQCTNGVLVIDSTNRVLYMSLPLMQKSEDISLDTIVGYTYNEDEKQYGVGRTVGGAVVGGILFSGVGAVIGSVIGANPKRRIRKISIEITYEAEGQCQLFIACLYKGKPLKASGREYESYMEAAKVVMGQLDLLLAKKENVQPEEARMGPSVSVADEIRKFKDLMDEGIITEEEFAKKKNQLLGMEMMASEEFSNKSILERQNVNKPENEGMSDMGESEKAELREYLIATYYPKDKTGAIKYYREREGVGIVEAKKYVDEIFANYVEKT